LDVLEKKSHGAIGIQIPDRLHHPASSTILLLLLLLLLLRWHYSLTRTFTSLIDLSQSALFIDLFPVFNFPFINTCLCTDPPYDFLVVLFHCHNIIFMEREGQKCGT